MSEQADDGQLDLGAVGERIEALLTSSAAGGVVAQERAEELVRLVTDLYGAGLERMLELLHDRGRLDETALEALAADDLVSGLLLVHGLHPYGVEERVSRALDGVRPYLGSHGGDVELLGITDEGVVRLRLLGSCDGCPSSSVTLKLAVEGAVEDAAPEVVAIEVEEPSRASTAAVIPVGSLFSRLSDPDPAAPAGGTWRPVPALGALASGHTTVVEVGGLPLLGVCAGGDHYAFRDGCPRCATSLTGATAGRRLGGAAADVLVRCPRCGAHFDVRRAGSCVEDPQLHLTPLPVLADATTVSVALPAAEVVG